MQNIKNNNEQDPKERINNFNEVALGYTPEQAVSEAERCLGCRDASCIQGCPVEIDIPKFIAEVKKENFSKAYQILKEKNNLPAVCGRVCPQETQCEKFCILAKKGNPIAIGSLERFVADWAISHGALEKSEQKFKELERDSAEQSAASSPRFAGEAGPKETQYARRNTKKIAVIGSGPAGLTAAADLSRMGYQVTIFESLHAAGGVLRYGIPEFRLPKRIVDIEIGYIKKIGVNIEVNMVIGKVKTIDELRVDGFKAFFVATGAGLPYFLGIAGENLNGVYSANEFLTRVNLMNAYRFPDYDTPVNIGRKVAVIGAGNVALDSARVSRRLGADEVTIVYRRSEAEMPARLEEIRHAGEEGIKFELLTDPVEISGNESGWVRVMKCLRNRLGEPDSSGRRRPVAIPNSEFDFNCDLVIVAIGQGPNPLLLSTIPALKLNSRGNIEANSDGRTSVPDIFAGGDIVTGAATVIEAMGLGKRAARAIHKYLNNAKR
ncbi:MAG: NADPH-dependent glutamate synthase [Candidatus Omnitrophota bacterium]|nr:NADPH-dependent glutamate synthase [Candidatus Omnitrophota bacterium]